MSLLRIIKLNELPRKTQPVKTVAKHIRPGMLASLTALAKRYSQWPHQQELSRCWDGPTCQSKLDRNLRGTAVPLSVAWSSGAGSPSNTMWPGTRPTSVPSDILIHPTVCMATIHQRYRQTDRQDNGHVA